MGKNALMIGQVRGDRFAAADVFRSSNAEPFDVMSICSTDGDTCSRVEFVR